MSSPEFPGERLVVCRNPAVAAERARKREELLTLTEKDLEKVKQMVDGPRGKLKHASAGRIGERAGRVVNKRKMAKHFTLQIADQSFGYQRNQAQIDEEALLDGIYVLRTQEPQARIGAAAVVRAYKQLKVNERVFRQMKTPLEIRPIHHRLEDRVRAHAFLCMLACYAQFELTRRLAPMLFCDDTPLAAADPVAPARRSPQAAAKAASARTADGQVAHSLEDLLKDLGTLCRNTIRIGNSRYTFTRLTTPTELQASAFEHLGIKPASESTGNRPPGTAKPQPLRAISCLHPKNFGLKDGNYVTPTLFADVENSMRIAQEEIFGPVLVLIPYDDVDDAIRIANDSEYGLSAGVWSSSTETALEVARRIRSGTVTINGSPISFDGPFGGYKASGTGREYGPVGLSEYLEYKSVTRKRSPTADDEPHPPPPRMTRPRLVSKERQVRVPDAAEKASAAATTSAPAEA